MFKKLTLYTFILLFSHVAMAQRHTSTIRGTVTQENGTPLAFATVALVGTSYGTSTNEAGFYELKPLAEGTYQIRISMLGFQTLDKKFQLLSNQELELSFALKPVANQIGQVEVFGEREKQPDKLDAITRLPLKPVDQLQSISVISDRLIEQQGALTVMEAARNVPGVYTYSTYGGVRESISSRGFRGIPTLKNGVRVMTDFRGMGFSTDMQGVESIQVLKGATSVTMGAADDLGGPGGIVNVVTKTPKFENGGKASLRVGSWGLVRPTFDVQGVLNETNTLAFRLNGAYERGGKYRDHMEKESFYINPSLAWRPDAKTSVILEMDYFNNNQTIDAGTVNLSVGNKENKIYDLPTDQFLGFESDLSIVKHTTFAARIKRDLNDQFYLRAAYFRSNYDSDAIRTSLSAVKANPANDINVNQVTIFNRSIGHNQARVDKTSVFQMDLVGVDVETGFLKHTLQAGFDYRTINLTQPIFNTLAIDQINVLDPATITNTLPSATPNFTKTGGTQSFDTRVGLMFQDVIQVTPWARLYGSLRYSTTQTNSPEGSRIERSNYWNPLGGVVFTLKEGLNLFGSYTNSTNPRSASVVDANGNTLGAERIDQIEAGIKSSWLNDRFRANLTLYKINNKDMNLEVFRVDEAGAVVPTGYFTKGGNDERKGVEVELTGRILPNLELVTGYAYIDAQYKEHTTFVPGSSPNNTPKHTFNAWANYSVLVGALRGANIGVGAYYLGKRPYNDWTLEGVQYHNIDPNTAPWYNKAYTTVNAQIGYDFHEHWGVRVLFNNILDEVGFDAYRTSFIDRIQPRNFSGTLTYRF
ncbi:TonB-dependent siderophore receptor [Rufibacter sediminis]|uniref:TonB-dependent receptor n=1 Tax=Rufibacter sediminis TaxID=2762756 RepID=A0ABR6VNN6_9BACT|nr:TonB-dependent receptor [Rufibacter sediminis]MBC3538804.1 TonB-dependent receptor [Rufibacter sediminis]